MRWGLVLCCLAACGGDEGGIDLEIHSEVTIDRVEVFVGNDHCYDDNGVKCEGGVAWGGGQPRPPGETFVMKSADPPSVLELMIETSEFEGDAAVLHLEADPGLDYIAVMALVGYAGTEPKTVALVKDQYIPRHAGEHWVIHLQKADPAKDSFLGQPATTDAPLRVKTWARENVSEPAKLSRCLAVQQWNNEDKIWDGLFIVPSSDHDCDGEAIECDPLYANLNQSTGDLLPACLGISSELGTPTDASPCVLGATPCVDGVDSDPSCVPGFHQCAPDKLCDLCTGPSGVEGCVAYSIRTDATVSHAECKFEPDASTGLPCSNNSQSSSAQLALPFSCNSIEVRRLSDPFSASMTTKFPSGEAMLGANYFASAANPDRCVVLIQWESGRADLGQKDWFLFAITPIDGRPTLLVPVRITFTDYGVDCNQPSSLPVECTVSSELGSDNFLRCAGVTPL